MPATALLALGTVHRQRTRVFQPSIEVRGSVDLQARYMQAKDQSLPIAVYQRLISSQRQSATNFQGSPMAVEYLRNGACVTITAANFTLIVITQDMYIIHRTEEIVTNGKNTTQTSFYTGNSWTDDVSGAKKYRFDTAVSLKTTLSVTVPMFEYAVLICGEWPPSPCSVALANDYPLTALGKE